MSLKPAQLQNFSLYSSGVSIGDITMTLSAFTSIDGVPLSMSDFGTIGYMTVEPGSRDREEQISFTGVTQNSNGTATLTGIKTVLFLSPYTESVGFDKSHPGGVTAVVTNTSGFYNKFPIKDNNESITGYWAVPDPVSNTDIANKEWVLSVVNGGSVSTNALITTGIAGETVSAGKIVYLKAADGRWWLASSASTATTDLLQLGIAQGSGTAGNNISGGVLLRGLDANQSALTPGTIYYLGTAGAISSSAGAIERAVGQSNSATTLQFDPDYYYIPTALQKAALAGNSGTPSGSNKYVTESGLTASQTDVQSFESGGTWTKPSGAKAVEVICIGAGGGGGGGNDDTGNAGNYSGGAGAGGGGVNRKIFPASILGSTETVTIGTGGTGGAGKSSNSGGNAGTDGGATSFGAWIQATGGKAGAGATSSGGSVGGAGGAGIYSGSAASANAAGGGAGGGAGVAQSGGSAGAIGFTYGAAGGGAGGSRSGNGGGDGGAQNSRATPIAGGTGGTGGGAGGAPSDATTDEAVGGAGGGGGGGASSGNAGAGGAGGKYGGGGGGGGTTVGSGTGGTGGTGGSGFCQVITYF